MIRSSRCGKKKYVYEHLITQMVDSQIFMYDVALAWPEIDGFLEHLRNYPEVYKKAIAYIERKQGNCQLILRKYKYHRGNKPIIIPGVYESIKDDPILYAGEQWQRIYEAAGEKGSKVYSSLWDG